VTGPQAVLCPDDCPLCGHALDAGAPLHIDAYRGVVLSGGRAIRLASTRIRILDELAKAMPDFVSTERLALKVYGAADLSNAHNALGVAIHHMRAELQHLNYRIVSRRPHGYRLVAR
jgi:DNA-binding response OmpR family regulator